MFNKMEGDDLSQSKIHEVPSISPPRTAIGVLQNTHSSLSPTQTAEEGFSVLQTMNWGLQTASGNAVSVSEEALKCAKALFAGIHQNENENVRPPPAKKIRTMDGDGIGVPLNNPKPALNLNNNKPLRRFSFNSPGPGAARTNPAVNTTTGTTAAVMSSFNSSSHTGTGTQTSSTPNSAYNDSDADDAMALEVLECVEALMADDDDGTGWGFN